jgi:UDP-N-acetylglucosamine 2-epimerase (non-hydrolysing)/GDP/UDP-N,N'-diacetylbacillosamine 2-epimerase (hydrolysing)
MTRKVCVVTGSRADFGFLVWPMREIAAHPELELQTVVTGAHLCPSFGHTVDEVEAHGFAIHARIDMLLGGDSAAAVTKSTGLGLLGFADVLPRLQPDLVLLLGDRFETFAAATACLIAGIPIAHLAGGDTTEGAFDEQLRHAITKMAHLHFVTNGEAARRVRQMGEDPARIFDVGSSGLDHVARTPRRPREEVFAEIGLRPRARNIVVTFHPATLDPRSSVDQLAIVLRALDALGPDVGVVVTGANADTEGASINATLRTYADARPNVVFRLSLPHALFINLLRQVDAVVGNSSCGLYEAPSFRIPTVNIGDRQRGRLRAESVIDCAPERDAIVAAVQDAFGRDCRGVINPYGDGCASPRIIAALASIDDWKALLVKRFIGPVEDLRHAA